MISTDINREIYEDKVIKSGKPTLLCFIKNNVCHTDTVISVEELSRQFETIQFYAPMEEEHQFFFEKFHFLGTPIFIFLVNGIEQGRLLGAVSTDKLRAFIEKHVNRLISQ